MRYGRLIGCRVVTGTVARVRDALFTSRGCTATTGQRLEGRLGVQIVGEDAVPGRDSTRPTDRLLLVTFLVSLPARETGSDTTR